MMPVLLHFADKKLSTTINISNTNKQTKNIAQKYFCKQILSLLSKSPENHMLEFVGLNSVHHYNSLLSTFFGFPSYLRFTCYLCEWTSVWMDKCSSTNYQLNLFWNFIVERLKDQLNFEQIKTSTLSTDSNVLFLSIDIPKGIMVQACKHFMLCKNAHMEIS